MPNYLSLDEIQAIVDAIFKELPHAESPEEHTELLKEYKFWEDMLKGWKEYYDGQNQT